MKVIMKNTVKNAKGKVLVTKGEVMAEAKAIKKGIRKCYYEVYNTSAKGTYYTEEEDRTLVSLYLSCGGNINEATDKFMGVYNTHTRSSVYQLASGLRTLDENFPNDTQWVVKTHIREVALDMAPERFA